MWPFSLLNSICQSSDHFSSLSMVHCNSICCSLLSTTLASPPPWQMMVTSEQEVQTITQTIPGFKFGHTTNPYEELTLDPMTAMFLVSGAWRNIANFTQ